VSERFDEMGLLGLAFHPDYADNGRFYVYYSTLVDGQHISRIAEYTALAADPDIADVATERVLLEIDQPEDNHNGGHLAFGSDNFLYIGMGDGGGADDQHGATGNGQNLSTLLGKMLRIDVDGEGAGPNDNYAIPAGNMTSGGALPEIWSYGLRNPWRYSFDACTGDMYIADVGQNSFEEVDFEPAQLGGRNYGWRLMEAEECFNPDSGCNAAQQNLTLPVASYDRNAGQSITGGYVYRGSAIPALRGTYLYADFESARFFALRMQGGAVATPQADITDNINPGREIQGISSFGQDTAGNLYVVEYGGAIYRIDAE
jgi:glucose/arabinose dehydrogenase